MTALRWLLGLSGGSVLAGFAVLVIVAGNFRRSFGASPTHPLAIILPTAGLLLLLAGVVFPSQRWLLHVGAAAALALLLVCAIHMSTISLVGIAYAAMWLLYYGLLVWQTPRLA